MFDKGRYWANRKDGIRGQETNESPTKFAKTGNKPVSNKAIRKNTKRARRAAIHEK